MKKHAKKALKHDVEVLGKTVPTLAIAALFLVGGGTAAVLTSFGTVTGQATVDQAVTINDNSAADGDIESSYSLSSNAGEESTSTNVISNNLDEPVTVDVQTTQETPEAASEVDSESIDSSANGITTEYYVVDELVDVDNDYGIDTSGSDEVEGDVSSEFVYDQLGDSVALHTYGQTLYAEESGSAVNPAASASYAGVTFDIQTQTYTGSNPVKVDYRVGEEHRSGDNQGTTPDWIMYSIDYDANEDGEEETYTVWTYTADVEEGEEFTMSGNVQAIKDSEGDLVHGSFDVPESDVSFQPSDIEGEAEINKVSVLTGSGADDETYVDMYYQGVTFDGTQLLQAQDLDSGLTLDQGDTYVGIFNEVAINAVPGQYSVTTQFQPDTE